MFAFWWCAFHHKHKHKSLQRVILIQSTTGGTFIYWSTSSYWEREAENELIFPLLARCNGWSFKTGANFAYCLKTKHFKRLACYKGFQKEPVPLKKAQSYVRYTLKYALLKSPLAKFWMTRNCKYYIWKFEKEINPKAKMLDKGHYIWNVLHFLINQTFHCPLQ